MRELLVRPSGGIDLDCNRSGELINICSICCISDEYLICEDLL